MNYKDLVIFIDSDDTIIDESTVVWNEGIMTSAKCLPGMKELVVKWAKQGYKVILLANGNIYSMENIFKRGDKELSDALYFRVYSEEVGAKKPHKDMFEVGFIASNIGNERKFDRFVMIGNDIHSDIAGANLVGIKSILFTCASGYDYNYKTPLETPTYVAKDAKELEQIVEKLESELENK